MLAQQERFVRGVVSIAGFPGFDQVWQAPENLPSLEELDDPRAWLERVDRRHALH